MSVSSVIAKMRLDGALRFDTGVVSKLSCVCENDLMAAYAKADEDRVFTRYSPWGEMRIGHDFGWDTPTGHEGKAYYVIVTKGAKPTGDGAAHVHPARVECVLDFGSSKQVRVKRDRSGGFPTSPLDEPVVGELDWRMTIDNPPAVAFFEAGRYDYFVAFYDADRFSMSEALADAHRVEADA